MRTRYDQLLSAVDSAWRTASDLEYRMRQYDYTQTEPIHRGVVLRALQRGLKENLIERKVKRKKPLEYEYRLKEEE